MGQINPFAVLVAPHFGPFRSVILISLIRSVYHPVVVCKVVLLLCVTILNSTSLHISTFCLLQVLFSIPLMCLRLLYSPTKCISLFFHEFPFGDSNSGFVSSCHCRVSPPPNIKMSVNIACYKFYSSVFLDFDGSEMSACRSLGDESFDSPSYDSE